MANQKINRNERYMLKGRLRKGGYDHWRLITSGISKKSGVEHVFFIEFYVLNPAVSPDKCVLGFESRGAVSDESLHAVLAGTQSVNDVQAETYVQPSFVMVKAGVFRENGKHVNTFFPSKDIQVGGSELLIKVGTDESNYCSLTNSSTYGSVKVTKEDLAEKPESMCQAGSISWNLRYERTIGFSSEYKSKKICWTAPGAKIMCEGKIIFDGEEYEVTTSKSNGYFEKKWGKEHLSQYFHLSSSKMSSLNTGKVMENSCFVVQGTYDEVVAVLLSIEGKKYCFPIGKAKKAELNYGFTEIDNDGSGEQKFHWTVSISDRKYVVDIDGFCSAKEMFLRDYECPEGNRKVFRVAGAGTGSGELKVFKKIKKSLEQIEYAKIENMVCEYGTIETPEL